MSQFVYVVEVQTQPILKLVVTRPKIADRVKEFPGYSEIQSFHITLARLDDLGLEFPNLRSLPVPPAIINLEDELLMVSNGEKTSLYAMVSESQQKQLKRYVEALSGGGPSLLDPNRKFHVTVGNTGGGDVRASVGAVWDYESQSV